MKVKTRVFTFHIFLQHYNAIKKLSETLRIPMTQIANTAIKEYVERNRTE